LLKLRKVEIVGFKSFCERTVVTSAAPAPLASSAHGCGKSNVVDAISWSSANRAKIAPRRAHGRLHFQWHNEAPALGLAEVTITMEDPELAEAARFVMENAVSDSATDSVPFVAENCAASTEATEILSLDPCRPRNTGTHHRRLGGYPSRGRWQVQEEKEAADKPVWR